MIRAICAIAAIAACGDNSAPTRPATLVSGAAQLDLSGDGQTLTLSRGGRALLVFHADAFQVGTVTDLDAGDSFDPYWLAVDAPPPPPDGLAWHTAKRLSLVSASGDALVIDVDTARLSVMPEGKDGFAAKLTTTAASAAYLRIRSDADPTEGFYGLGEWPSEVDHRGKLIPAQMEVDAMSESSDDENHVPVPLVLGTTGWGMFVESRRPGAFDLARQSATMIEVTFGTGADTPSGLAFHLFTADQPLDLLGRYFDVAGYPGLPAPWALGPLLWRDGTRDQAQVIDDISQIRSRHLATSGMWFDHPYSTGVETFDFAAKFPDPMTMLGALHDAGFRYGLWQVPYTAPSSSGDPAQMELDYATSHGFFPPTTAILLNPWGKPIDFTNPAAYEWWRENLRTYTEGYGVEGFKLDYGEDVVVGLSGRRAPWKFADGSDELTMHYGYQLLYHKIHHDLLGGSNGLLLCRTGRWGDQVNAMIIWPGDLDATMGHAGDPLPNSSMLAVGGLPAALAKGIGLSASGFPFYASDTGGYRMSPPNKETWVRWVEANAVWPAMEVGDASSEMPWEFTAANGRDQEALDIFTRYASLHLRLFPYIWTYAQQIAKTGWPIARPAGLGDPALGAHPADEYFLGDYMFSAPVVTPGATSRAVQLPKGTWYGWWDGQPASGAVTAAADLGTLPLYLADGGIVAMLRPTIETLSPVVGTTIDSFDTDPGVIWVRVAPASATASTAVALYDGTQLTRGASSFGYQPGSVFAHGVMFEAIATPAAPAAVMANGSALAQQPSLAALETGDGWFWEPATGGTLWVHASAAAMITY